LIEFYIAQLHSKCLHEDPLTAAKQGKTFLSVFLDRCDRLGLLKALDKERLTAEKGSQLQLPPAEKRARKIAEYQREKATEKRLQVRLYCDRILLQHSHFQEVLAAQKRAAETGETSDDSVDRERILITIDLSAQIALKDLDMTEQVCYLIPCPESHF
jgi:hypothetical protein